MTTVKTTINLDENIFKTIKIIANNKETTQTKLINEYLKEAIEKEPKENKTKIKFLVKPDPTKNIDDLVGSIKASKGFDPVKAVNEVRKGE
ncbi:hypothetical protein SDC9_37496 [bioreactor metagenome]|uniref:Uncharacterized protein n=1 Tax=bioreactor metagenome TaxID=1076179 RepID=A0A644VJA2_9ZZZZ|nr:DUF6364 family protein [Methanobrevibacter sp.]MEA4957650.1 DUF6364 family protein [Methanobrevibacter sp.]